MQKQFKHIESQISLPTSERVWGGIDSFLPYDNTNNKIQLDS